VQFDADPKPLPRTSFNLGDSRQETDWAFERIVKVVKSTGWLNGRPGAGVQTTGSVTVS
jgi:hypothetical protein